MVDLPAEMEKAFASVPRERFLGPGPWKVWQGGTYLDTRDDDPRHVYHNLLYGLSPERQLNNGQPSFLALLIKSLGITAGDHVVHLGCGVGYYTAVMSELAGGSGKVTAIEADPALAERARNNLTDYATATVQPADALGRDFEPADAVLVNFGMTHAPPAWLKCLKPDGRLLLPVTEAGGSGMFFRFEKSGDSISATAIAPTVIYPSVSGRDPALEARLGELMSGDSGSAVGVNQLRLDAHDPEPSCWLHGQEMCLSKRTLESEGPLSPYVGTFALPRGNVVFAVREGKLHVRSLMGGGALERCGEDRFARPGMATFQFASLQDGHFERLEVELAGRKVEGSRTPD